MSKGIKQTPDDLQRHMNMQLRFLKASSSAYDQGFVSEAKRIAAALRILLHDTSSSTSLLQQLDMKDIMFLDTSIPYEEDSLSSYSGLTEMGLSEVKGSFFQPLYDQIEDVHRKVKFDKWWNCIIFADQDKVEITRRDLVLSVVNQDGGAHVDPYVNEPYGRLSREEFLKWKETHKGIYKGELKGADHAAIRQIGHEILTMFVDDYQPPEINKEPGTVYYAGVSVVKLDNNDDKE